MKPTNSHRRVQAIHTHTSNSFPEAVSAVLRAQTDNEALGIVCAFAKRALHTNQAWIAAWTKNGELFTAFDGTKIIAPPPCLRDPTEPKAHSYLCMSCPLLSTVCKGRTLNLKRGELDLDVGLVCGEISEEALAQARTPLEDLLSIAALRLQRRFTEERQQTLALEENLKARLMDVSPVGILTIDPRARIEFANERARQLLGLEPRDESLQSFSRRGARLFDLKGTLIAPEEFILAFVLKEKVSRFEQIYVLHKPDGTKLTIILNATPQLNNAGEVTSVISTIQDITRSQHTELSLEASRENYRSVIESMTEGVAVYSPDGELITCNEAAEEILGLTTEQMKGLEQLPLKWRIFKADGSPYPLNQRPAQQTLRTGLPQRAIPMQVHKPDGSITWLSVNSQPVRGPGAQHGVVTTFADVTERKRLEQERERLRQQHLYAQRMESLGKLARGIAHDFNNIMSCVLSYAELIRKYSDDQSLVLEGAEAICESAERASQITHQLVGFSRGGKLKDLPFSLHEVIENTVQIVSRAVDPRVTLQLTLDSPLDVIKGDITQIEQVFMNLAINACQAMPDGGTLEIETRYLPPASPIDASSILIELRDSGEGIDQENLEQVFEPFFTTRPTHNSSGMGLAMVYGIVQNHRGTIEVHSTKGAGTTFKVVFSLHTGEATPLARLNAPLNPDVSSNKGLEHCHVLIVDDEKMIRDSLSRYLLKAGCLVDTARDGVEAIERFHDEIDLVILDLLMPKKDGFAVFDELKAERPDLPVIIMTGYAAEEKVQRLVERGLSGLISKPFSIDELSKLVQSVVSSTKHAQELTVAKDPPNPVVAARKGQRVTLEPGTHYWCRCGRSSEQPLCDGSHAETEFEPFEFAIKKQRNALLCNCKHTKNPPYCDGSHHKLPAETKRKPLDTDPEMWAALDDGEGLVTILDDFYTSVFADPQLAPFFKDVTKDWVAQKQYSFLRQIFTGEDIYFGYRPRNAHHWMVISDELFDHREDLLAAAMRRYGVPEPLVARMRSLDEVFRKQIVKDTPRARRYGGIIQPLRGYESIEMSSGWICDGCAAVLEPDESAQYHKRTGKAYCVECMHDRTDDDIE